MSPPEQREVLVLMEAVGLSFGEARRISRKPPGRFKCLFASARANLAFDLAKQRSEADARRDLTRHRTLDPGNFAARKVDGLEERPVLIAQGNLAGIAFVEMPEPKSL
jgi:hypothetical protein